MYFLYALRLLNITLCLAQTVGIRLSFDPPTLDWNLGDVPIHVINNVVEGLYSIDASGHIVPEEAFEMPRKSGKPRNTSWRIRLKPGLKWSDGKPLRARDYVDSWTRLLDPRTGSTYAYLLFDLEGARAFNAGKAKSFSAARAIGDTELEIRLEDKHAGALPLATLTHWATFPIRADMVEANGSGWGSKPEKMAFNGPYYISAYQPEGRLELLPNQSHRTPGKLEKIEAFIIQDDTTALRLYESGKLHFMPELGQLERNALATRPDYHSMSSPVLVYLGIDTTSSALTSRDTRRALSLAVDRSLLPKLLGLAFKPTSAITPSSDEPSRFDPSAAKKLAAELVASRHKMTAGFFQKGVNRMVMEFLQEQWLHNLGIEVALSGAEVKTYWSRLSKKPYPYSVFLNTYGPPVLDERYYYELLQSKNPMNLGHWSDASYDRALQRHDWPAAQRILEAEVPVIPLYFRAYDYLMSPRLKGAVLNPMTSLYLRDAQLR